MTVDDIIKRQKTMAEHRTNWESVWEEIIEYVVPRRTELEDNAEKGGRHDQKIYNGSGIDALKLLSDGLQGNLMSANYPWAGFRMENERLNELPPVKRWLQTLQKEMFSFLGNSNYYRQAHEFFMDAGSFGTGYMYVEANVEQREFVFSARHPKECWISTNKYGVVDTIHRRTFMTPRQMVQRFGDKVHEDIKEMLDKNTEDTFPILHAIYPNNDREYLKPDNQNMLYASKYIDEENEHELSSSGYRTFPYAAWRFYKNSDEIYGRSPSWNALAAIKGLEDYDKLSIWAAQMAVKPPMWNPASHRNKLRIVPGGMNYYEMSERESPPVPLVTGIKEPVNLELIQRKEEAISKHFMVDFFLIVSRAEKEMTATEVREAQEEKSVVLGPTVNGLEQEGIEPLFDRMFDIGMNLGWFTPPPPILLQGGGQIRIDYLGPLAQAQRRFFRNQPIRNAMSEVFPVFEIQPQTMDNFNWDFIARELADGSDLPQGGYMDPELVAQVRQQRAAQVQQQQQAELAATQAPAMETASKIANEQGPA